MSTCPLKKEMSLPSPVCCSLPFSSALIMPPCFHIWPSFLHAYTLPFQRWASPCLPSPSLRSLPVQRRAGPGSWQALGPGPQWDSVMRMEAYGKVFSSVISPAPWLISVQTPPLTEAQRENGKACGVFYFMSHMSCACFLALCQPGIPQLTNQ